MRLQTTLLDRLVDDAPDLTRDPPMTRTQEMMAIRAGFCRDLEALLNTRRLFPHAAEGICAAARKARPRNRLAAR